MITSLESAFLTHRWYQQVADVLVVEQDMPKERLEGGQVPAAIGDPPRNAHHHATKSDAIVEKLGRTFIPPAL